MNSIIWYELLTSDPDAATAFYSKVLGWKTTDSGQADRDYRIFNKDDVAIGGLMALPAGAAEAGMPPGWLGYVGVKDVDVCVAGALATGGTEFMPAVDIPDVGRIALIGDPQGAALYLMSGSGTATSNSYAPGKPGHGGWHELHTSNWQEAWAFYSAQLDWQKAEEMDMGPMGTYLLFDDGSNVRMGGMFNNPMAPRAYWLYYFNVQNIDEANELVKAHGGTTLQGPIQVPTGDWIIQAFDPQGALFALVGPRTQAH
ncbi:VOC family protein [Granulosicoccus antarcticus]|uniref:27 kDa antigen Cfp30B n=1 Tax=Granulosicoccus antarcticus IMCC3135 TaxID=1192854 RepID=A0A2Z2P0M0_9GAMM|nr:VOC family protein [Granulosicoccus antarcticus]ASJ73034.1 27 kDa antigen Cfp30B [Granulosicoccus antarcticus IMCC3135]